jgi:DUF971 family protein
MRIPLHVDLDAGAQTLTLHWPDGVTQRFAHRVLRQACPCAECRRIRIGGHEPSVSPSVEVVKIRPVGYGVQLVFSDRHERGIFPWSYLERLQVIGPPGTLVPCPRSN